MSSSVNSAAQAQRRWLSALWRQARWRMSWAMLAPLFEGAVLVVQAWLLARLLDQAIRLSLPLEQLWPSIVAIVVCIASRAGLRWSGEHAASQAAATIQLRLRQQLFAQILANGPAWSKQQSTGALLTSLIEQVQALDGYLQRFIPASVAAVCLPLAFALVVLPVDWIVALLFLVTAPLIPLFMALIGMGAESVNQKHQQELSRITGLFADRLKGIFTLALLGRTQDQIAEVRQSSQRLSKTTMKVLRIAFLSSAVLELFAALGVAGVAVYIGLSYLHMFGEQFAGFSLQHGLFCLLLAPEVYNPLRTLAASYHDRATAKAAVNEIQQLYTRLPALDEQPPLAATAGFIEWCQQPEPWLIQARSFSVQTPSGHHLIQPTDFELNQGEHIALMGASGMGKTTLLESLIGLRPYAHGQLRLNLTPDQCILLSQHPFIAQGSIADFLLGVCPTATTEQLWQALEQAQAAEFVRAQPQGLATVLGTRAHGISGGQAHRLSLARLFLSSAPFILLDEPTAHLDAQTRDQLLHSVLQFAHNKTLIVATHDPEVAQQLDYIWHIEHQQLLRSRP